MAIVNLDPANDLLPYKPDVDVSDLIHLTEVMDRLRLGPNGGLVYAMEFLEQNLDWLQQRLAPLEKGGRRCRRIEWSLHPYACYQGGDQHVWHGCCNPFCSRCM